MRTSGLLFLPTGGSVGGPLWFRKRGDVLSLLAFNSVNVEKGIQRRFAHTLGSC